MPSALILSSYVAASRVGGMAQAFALARFGIDPVLIPTTLFGRHPGWGSPGGAAVEPEVFEAMIAGAQAQGALAAADVLLTGYFASPEQVAIAAEAIDRARKAPRPGRAALQVIVDPVMGDHDTGLYVPESVAEALARDLAPRADVITPNLWELGRITGMSAADAQGALQAARALGWACVVTSVPGAGNQIGALYVDAAIARLALHRRFAHVPRGSGDLLSAMFAVGLIEGDAPEDALVRAVGAVADTLEVAVACGAAELPVVPVWERLVRPKATVRIESLDSIGGV